MSTSNYETPVKAIKKKIARKLSFSNMSSLSDHKTLKEKTSGLQSFDGAEIDIKSSDSDLYRSSRIRDAVKNKYNVDLGELTQQLERELSSSSEQDNSCWSPESILNLIDGLRVPLELLVKIIQAVKSTIK